MEPAWNVPKHDSSLYGAAKTYLRQIANVVRVEQQLLQTVRVAEDLLRHVRQRRVPVVDVLDLPVASLEYRYVLEHPAGGLWSRGGGRKNWMPMIVFMD